MSVSRDKVSDIIDFFDMTDRKCIIIWERTAADSANPMIEISASIKEGYSEFFREASVVLRKIADELESNGLEDQSELFD